MWCIVNDIKTYYRNRLLDRSRPAKSIVRDGRKFVRVYYPSAGNGLPREHEDVSEEDFIRHRLVIRPYSKN